MYCPYCRHPDSRVLDSRVAEDGSSIRRRRECKGCQRRFTTLEQMQLVVVKRSGVVEAFSREKVIGGVRKACKGRPVTEQQLARLGQQVEESIRASGQAEVPAEQVGVAILGPLKELDPVAYLRFASVYRNYESVDDFETEIARLRAVASSLGAEAAHAPGGTREPDAEPEPEHAGRGRGRPERRDRAHRVDEPEPATQQLF